MYCDDIFKKSNFWDLDQRDHWKIKSQVSVIKFLISDFVLEFINWIPVVICINSDDEISIYSNYDILS